jgi:hypothetical protein
VRSPVDAAFFNERFDADVLAPWARRTARLDHIMRHLALALGGRDQRRASPIA